MELALAYVLLLAVVSLEVPLALSLRDRVDSEVKEQAHGQAAVLAASAADFLGAGGRAELRRLVTVSARAARGRVIVVDRRGRLLVDSVASSALAGTSYADRPEVAAALRGHTVQGRRSSRTLDEELLTTAVPILRRGTPAGAVRITQSVAAVHRAVRRSILELAAIGLVVLVLGLGAGALIAAEVARPITRLDSAARRIATGDLSARVPEEGAAEQRGLARSFNEMTARVERLVQSQRDFVADASHQLRTPLTAARLRMEEARAAGMPAEASRELDAGLREIDRMAQMIDELLILSRAGERELPEQLVDLGGAVRNAAERWRLTARDYGIAIAVHTPASATASAWCAPSDLDRALDALIENAVRYAGSARKLELVLQPGRIEVRDRGPGLTAGEEAAVWSRFHQGSAGRAVAGGTGLGLPIARELARTWGGDATLAARPGGGLVAALVFPATPCSVARPAVSPRDLGAVPAFGARA